GSREIWQVPLQFLLCMMDVDQTALDSDDLLYLKEQMEAEDDAEPSLVDAASVPSLPPIRVEPKPRSGIRQQVLVKNILEVKPKRLTRVAHNSTDAGTPSTSSPVGEMTNKPDAGGASQEPAKVEAKVATGGLLGLAYESEEDSDPEIEQVPAYTEMKAQRRESQTDLL
ncbi:unnamed protein product, partial [Sphagnum jensenii]